jgi:hypothetical protein
MAPGRDGRGEGAGAIWGLRKAQCRNPSSRGSAAGNKQDERAPSSRSPRPGAPRARAGWGARRPGLPARAPGGERAAPGSGSALGRAQPGAQ